MKCVMHISSARGALNWALRLLPFWSSGTYVRSMITPEFLCPWSESTVRRSWPYAGRLGGGDISSVCPGSLRFDTMKVLMLDGERVFT